MVTHNGVGLSISCSATFEQLFRFGATFSPSSNFSDFVQLFSFLNNFLAFLKLKTVHSSSNLKHQLFLCMILRKIPFVNKKHYSPGGLPVVAAEGGQRICLVQHQLNECLACCKMHLASSKRQH